MSSSTTKMMCAVSSSARSRCAASSFDSPADTTTYFTPRAAYGATAPSAFVASCLRQSTYVSGSFIFELSEKRFHGQFYSPNAREAMIKHQIERFRSQRRCDALFAMLRDGTFYHPVTPKAA